MQSVNREQRVSREANAYRTVVGVWAAALIMFGVLQLFNVIHV
jgi:hypothetical protein